MKFKIASTLGSVALLVTMIAKASASDFNPENMKAIFELKINESDYLSCVQRADKTLGCEGGGCEGVGPLMMAVCRCESATNTSDAERICEGVPKETELGAMLEHSHAQAKQNAAQKDPLITLDLAQYAYHSVWSAASKGNTFSPGVSGPLPELDVPQSVKNALQSFTTDAWMTKCEAMRGESPGDPLLRSDRSTCFAVGALHFESVNFCNELPNDTSISGYMDRDIQPPLNLITLCKTALVAKTGDGSLCGADSYCLEQSEKIREFKSLSGACKK